MSLLLPKLVARNPGESHRASTPLELLFDLVAVIAIASAAAGLHHAISENHIVEGVTTFLMAFFAVWWAWMNYTWFASAFDNDDALFRLITMLIMSGSLTIAAGIGELFKSGALTMVVVGYVIMRIGMIWLWLRVAAHDLQRRAAALTYAAGIFFNQILWVVFLLLQPLTPALSYSIFVMLAVFELAVPMIAERKSTTPWHRHHMIERYGLLTIIVLGETLLSGAMSLQQVSAGITNIAFVHIAMSALVIVFSMWWLYFSKDDHLASTRLRHALQWGYGHFIIFSSGAMVGAGFAVLVDIIGGHAKVPLLVGDYAVGIPVALYMFGLWFVRDRFNLRGPAQWVLPGFATLVLLAPLTPVALEGIAALTALSVVARHIMIKGVSRAKA